MYDTAHNPAQRSKGRCLSRPVSLRSQVLNRGELRGSQYGLIRVDRWLQARAAFLDMLRCATVQTASGFATIVSLNQRLCRLVHRTRCGTCYPFSSQEPVGKPSAKEGYDHD